MNKQSDLYNFLRAIAIGFGIVSIGIAIALVGYIAVTKSLH
ncbi:MAG: hypothetical protein AAB600_03810 [Patescibacteria group bacterium]